MLITASWFPDLKNVVGLQGVSQVWQDNPSYYLWLKGVPCVFQLECNEAHYKDGFDERLIYSAFSVRAFPFRNTDLYLGFSEYEKKVLNSPIFDGSNTPSFDHLQDLDKNLFLVSGIEWIFPENACWNLFTMNAFDLSVIRSHSSPVDPLNLSSEPSSTISRRVPSWEISLPLFDALNTLHVFYSKQKLRNLRVISRNGFEYVVSFDGKTKLVDRGVIKNLEVVSLFMNERLFVDDGITGLLDQRFETDFGDVIFDRTFDWNDRSDNGFILKGSSKAIGRQWWSVAEASFDSSVACPCGCNHD
ncbi:MAG: hypothetical protein V1897_00940 [Pseudomonadota bacterium]